MNYLSSLSRLRSFFTQYQITLFFGLIALVSLYLLLPLVASYFLVRELAKQGYDHVIVQLGYPGLQGIHVPVMSLQQDLGGETLSVSLTNAEIQYRLSELFRGHVTRVFLPDVSIQLLNTLALDDDESDDITPERGEPQWKFSTAGDVLQRMPILPFDELILDRVTIFREEATGPLRKVTVSGSMTHREGELGGHLSFQGQDTASYGLTITGNSASTWSAILVSQRFQSIPILSWKSQAYPDGPHIHVDGQLDINVRELAPFIALLVPIGPELEKVTGQVVVNWNGTTAADAALTSLWQDPSIRLEGHIQAQMTLPALKGIAKEVALSFQGTFTGNAVQAGWTLDPGTPLVATINGHPSFMEDSLRKILPQGDQPLSIEHAQPVHGTLFLSESPARMIVEGPLHITYGKTQGPLVAEVETRKVEWAGNALLSAKGTYHVSGVLPKPSTGFLFASEMSAELRGTFAVTRESVEGQVLPSSIVKVTHIERGGLFIPSLTLQFTKILPLQCDLAVIRCHTGPVSAAIRIPVVRALGQEVRVAHGVISLQLVETTPNSWHAQGKLGLRGVSPDLAPWAIAPTDWKIRFVANQAGIKADLHIDAPFHNNLVAAEIDHPLGTGEGMLHSTIGPVEFDEQDHRLSRLIAKRPLPIEILRGRFTSTVDLSWSGGMGSANPKFKVTSGTATIAADKLSGRYGNYDVHDASTTMTLQAHGMESIATVEPASVTIESVHTGIKVTNLSALVQGHWLFGESLPVIEMKDFRCEAFGGTVASAGLVADFAKPPHQMTLSIQNFDLAKILSVEHNTDLHGTGILNGTLPVSFALGGLTIQEGTMSAAPPGGIIQYRSELDPAKAVSETGMQLHVVTQALSNFHYTVLDAGVDYTENGTLFLAARLEGRNPDLKNIPPINFNLTVQEHIPTLLKSLRLVEDLETAMEKRYTRP